jgi:hypothetical protein
MSTFAELFDRFRSATDDATRRELSRQMLDEHGWIVNRSAVNGGLNMRRANYDDPLPVEREIAADRRAGFQRIYVPIAAAREPSETAPPAPETPIRDLPGEADESAKKIVRRIFNVAEPEPEPASPPVDPAVAAHVRRALGIDQ